MWRVSGTVLLCIVALGLCVAAELPQLDVGGFSWAENLAFDPSTESLFVSDAVTGILWRLYLNEEGSAYNKEKWASFKFVGGLTKEPNSDVLYANAKLLDDGLPYIVAVNTSMPETYVVVASMPRIGNGLALHYSSGTLFATSEGDFLPLRGQVYEISTKDGNVGLAIGQQESSDGCRVDNERNLLYFSNVLSARVSVYDLNASTGAVLARNVTYSAPGMQMLDDFCLDSTGELIYAADFHNGTVVVFNADGSSTEPYYLMEGLANPTSVRFGAGNTFNTSSVFVTEGGPIVPEIKNRHVLQGPYSLNLPIQ